MRRLLALLACLAAVSPAVAATRMYFIEPGSNGGVASPISPTVDAGWEASDENARTMLNTSRYQSPLSMSTCTMVANSANEEVRNQFASPRMAAGAVFTSASTTVTMQLMTRESNADDNIDNCIIGVRVVSEDGATVRATLLAVANYGLTTEFCDQATCSTGRNKTCADGDTVTATYTTVDGDRLLVEVGAQTSTAASTTPVAGFRWGEASADCAVNETATGACSGWIEFSNTITFLEAIIPPRGPRLTRSN